MSTDVALTVAANADAAHRPDYIRPEQSAGKAARDLCAALMRGTAGIRALGKAALPKWPAEEEAHYRIRAAISQLARYYARTVQASVGMICSTPPALADDADSLIVADAEDIDGRGAHFEVFAKQVCDDAITGGFCAILVDAPPIPDDLHLTLADEQALGLRPFWVSIPAERILSWIVDVPNWAALLAAWKTGELTAEQVKGYAKQTIVRQVVIAEPTDVPSGPYGVTAVDRYRVLALTDTGVTFAVWEKRKADGSVGEHFIRLESGAMLQASRQPFREIPLAIVYGGRMTAPFVAEPPLLALAELNLDHYQVSADRRYLMRLCHAPTLFLAGVEEEIDEAGHRVPIKVGPNSVLASANPLAKAAYIAANPNALDSSKQEKEEIVRQMAVLGMSFIGKDRRGMAETATGRALDDAAENASHATVARGLQDGLEQALKFHAMYRGVKAPSVTVNTSYASAQVDAQLAALIWQAVVADKLPIEVFVAYITTGSLPDDIQESIDLLRYMQIDASNTDAALQVDQQQSAAAVAKLAAMKDSAAAPMRGATENTDQADTADQKAA